MTGSTLFPGLHDHQSVSKMVAKAWEKASKAPPTHAAVCDKSYCGAWVGGALLVLSQAFATILVTD